ncbi:MAG: Holliday junction branch migration protein RuvA [Bifidobacteriaceae bacterium]|jgi:Holliday junction DNA helicase RuvA|nr:Holliday junction branch migration protein RuvA [Bifidobacteriaceae bacterium]
MIASLRGPVIALDAGQAVIECGGVGLAVTLSPAARDGLREGTEAHLMTHLVVREDSLTLYGFANRAERDTFVTAQSAPGVGPRLALALVATLGPEGLSRAVASEDLATLTRVPGIGRKGAQKLVLALSGKLAPAGSADGAEAGAPAPADSAAAAQVSAALESLGWPSQLAAQAVAKVSADRAAPADVPGLLRAALRELGGTK